MNIVIPLGTGTKWQNNELRYCLRGIEMYCKDADNIVIVGEKPEWITNILHIPAKDAHSPTLSIWNKVLLAAKCHEVSEDFFFCNDDYFWLSEFTFKDYPYYYTDVTGNSPYKKILRRTMDVCRKSGLTALNYDVHKPMIINKALFQETYEFFSWHLPIDQGLVMKSCYCNLQGVTGEWMQDKKLFRGNNIPEAGMFSISDDFIDQSFKYYCSQRWPEKSKYEI